MVIALTGCEQRVAAPTPPAGPLAPGPARLEAATDHYVNRKWGYSIAVPRYWRARADGASDDGAVFENEAGELRTFAKANKGDAAFRAEVAALRASSDSVSGGEGFAGYRAVADGDEGFRVHLRLMRRADGALIGARMSFPDAWAARLDPVAVATLDSLALT